MDNLRKYLLFLIVAIFAGSMAACAPTHDRRGSGEFVDDAGLTARVKAALVKTPNVPAAAINVNTYRGEVVLSGYVNNEPQIQMAEEAARNVPGVKVVRNDLHVSPRR
jgi:hyperosmotically inducible protein